jgi:F-type H+-transporting ATPase subunit delta
MAAKKQTRELAQKLVAISLDDGQVSAQRVGEVLKALGKNPPRNLKALLGLYKKFILREIAKYTARVEHAGPLTDAALSTIQSFLESELGRKILLEAKPNEDLLAGIRITVGDDVYEDSAEFRLRPLVASHA